MTWWELSSLLESRLPPQKREDKRNATAAGDVLQHQEVNRTGHFRSCVASAHKILIKYSTMCKSRHLFCVPFFCLLSTDRYSSQAFTLVALWAGKRFYCLPLLWFTVVLWLTGKLEEKGTYWRHPPLSPQWLAHPNLLWMVDYSGVETTQPLHKHDPRLKVKLEKSLWH